MKVIKITVAPGGGCSNEQIELPMFTPAACLEDAYGDYVKAIDNWDNFVHQKFSDFVAISTVLEIGGKYITYVARA